MNSVDELVTFFFANLLLHRLQKASVQVTEAQKGLAWSGCLGG